MKAVFVSQRFVIVELDNNLSYYNDVEYTIYLNKEVYKKDNRNVFGIYDLLPDTNYEIEVLGEVINVRTKEETICLHTDLFKPYKDGINNDSLKLQTAILSCPDGGTVYIDKGTYLITSLFLKSNVNIYLDKDAKLVCEYDRDKFPVLPGLVKDGEKELNLGSFEGSEQDLFASFITGINVENVVVGGLGEIDGRAFMGDWYQKHNEIRGACRPHGIYLNKTKNIVMAGFFIHDTACWNIHPYFSEDLKFLDLRIENPIGMPTTDGIDPDCCLNTLILGCRFKVGDDCIAVKSGTIEHAKKYRTPTSNLIVRNCLMEEGHGGVVFGSESSGGINKVLVTQTYFRNTDRGLRIKTRRGRGRYGIIEDVVFKNIKMDNVLTPFVVNMYYNSGPKGGHDPFVWSKEKQKVDISTPYIGSFVFEDIECKNVSIAAGVFLGLPEEPIKSIKLVNVSFSYKEDAKAGYPVMIEHKKEMLKSGLYLEFVDKLILDNVSFTGNIGKEVISDEETEIKRISRNI